MNSIKKYLGQEFQVDKLILKYDRSEEFYLTSMQRSFSPIPCLCIRLVLFSTCVGILVYSMVITIYKPYWPIYMTNWGVVIITVTTGLALAVSVKASFKRTHVSTPDLPWYLKLYWAWHSMGICVAFLITLLYYSLLNGPVNSGPDYNPTVDLLTHGINSVAMFLLLVTSAHPSHILHCVYPLLFVVVYLAFSHIYHYAGGLNPQGKSYIYPLLDWSKPKEAAKVVYGCMVGVILLHVVVVLMSLLRNYLIRRHVIKTNNVIIKN